MANKKHKSISSLNDSHIVFNGKNYVYSDMFTGDTGYVLLNSDTERYALLSSRLVASVSVGMIVFFLMKNVVLALVIGIGLYTVAEILFRVKFLPSLNTIKNYQRPKRLNPIDNLVVNFSFGRLALMIAFGTALVVLIPINAKLNNYEGLIYYANYTIAAGIAIYVIIVIIAIIKKKIQNK